MRIYDDDDGLTAAQVRLTIVDPKQRGALFVCDNCGGGAFEVVLVRRLLSAGTENRWWCLDCIRDKYDGR